MLWSFSIVTLMVGMCVAWKYECLPVQTICDAFLQTLLGELGEDDKNWHDVEKGLPLVAVKKVYLPSSITTTKTTAPSLDLNARRPQNNTISEDMDEHLFQFV